MLVFYLQSRRAHRKIILNIPLIHSLTSVYKVNTMFCFKCHLQSHFKFVEDVIKITFSVYLLQHVSASQGHHQATLSRSNTTTCNNSM
jgi:hypothetical protein